MRFRTGERHFVRNRPVNSFDRQLQSHDFLRSGVTIAEIGVASGERPALFHHSGAEVF